MTTYLYAIIRIRVDIKLINHQNSLAFNRFASQGIKMIIQTGFEVDRTIINKRNITDIDKSISSFRIKSKFHRCYF